MAKYYTPSKPILWVYAVVIALSFLLMAWIVRGMYRTDNPGRVNSRRAEERIKARRELEAAFTAELNNRAALDKARGIERIPIQQAMEMVVRDWENPAAGRSNLLGRLQRASTPAEKLFE
jgi:hypothetical protein